MIIHTVSASDSIYSISKQYGVPENRIITDNFLNPEKKLIPGQTLIIARPLRTCAVRGGDTAESIAAENHISVLSLLQNNPQIMTEGLTPSQTLNILYEKPDNKQIVVEAYTGNATPAQVEKHMPYVSILAIQNGAHIQNGKVVPVPTVITPFVNLAKKYRAMPFLVLESVDEYGHFDSDAATRILSSPDMTEDFVQSAVQAAKSHGASGVEVNFAGLRPEDRYKYADLILALKGVAADRDLHVNAPLIPNESVDSTDENLVDTTDFTPLWTYIWDDESSASPAAPYDRIETLLNAPALKKYSKKLLLGIPTFGLDYTRIGNGYRKEAMNASLGIETVNRPELTTRFDEQSHTPFVEFTEGVRKFPQSHIMRFEDARSVSEKLDLLDNNDLGGVNIMSMEYELPVLWQLLNQRYKIMKY